MSSFTRFITPAVAALALTGCASLQNTFAKPPFEDTETAPEAAAAPLPSEAAPEAVEPQLETETASSGALGETIASLGDPTKPGFWLKTPLVSAETPGRVTRPDGSSVQVTLLPLDGVAGAGSEISLSAMRSLGLSLTDLAPLTVFRITS